MRHLRDSKASMLWAWTVWDYFSLRWCMRTPPAVFTKLFSLFFPEIFSFFTRHGGFHMRCPCCCVFDDVVKFLVIRFNVTEQSRSACSVQLGFFCVPLPSKTNPWSTYQQLVARCYRISLLCSNSNWFSERAILSQTRCVQETWRVCGLRSLMIILITAPLCLTINKWARLLDSSALGGT